MLFNSLEFLLFFPIVIAIYFGISYKYRWMLLLAASYYFYMAWKPEYIILIVISTLVDYYSAIQIEQSSDKKRKKAFLILSLISNLGILFTFKYFNFFSESVRDAFNYYNIFLDVPWFDLLLPIGISFYTFQTLSYTIDVYKGKSKAERHLGIFALYVSFFPQLVAGPIERSTNLLPQFRQNFDFDYNRVRDGLKLMLWGFFKKIVIADNLAQYVDKVYQNPELFDGNTSLLATYFFAFQIFCDFSGYSDIAIGVALVMGYNLMENFRRPYYSKNISEFWRRWHISLSTWFKDYLYIPLGGNRVLKWRWYYNLFIVFLVSGLWHGANWTFVIWGALHGFYIVAELISKPFREKVFQFFRFKKNAVFGRFIQIFVTFHLVLFAWIFFRANNLTDALIVIENIFTKIDLSKPGIAIEGFSRFNLLVAFGSIAIMEIVHLWQRKCKMIDFLNKRPLFVRWAYYLILLYSIFIFGNFNNQQFIYFEF